MARGLRVPFWALLVVLGLVAASAVPGAAEEMFMLRGYPNIWVPKSKVIGEPQVTVPAERGEEMVMLRGYPNLWVSKARVIGEAKTALPTQLGLAPEELIMLRGYPNLWVPKARVE